MTMLREIGDYLMRFDGDERREDEAVQEAEVAAETELITPLDAEVEEGETREELIARIRAEAKMEFAAQLFKERQASEERMTAERGKWVSEEGERLSDQITLTLKESMSELACAIETILRPFVVGNLLRQLLDDFVETLQALAANRADPFVRLSGPSDLTEAIGAKLSEKGVATEIVVSEEVEVKATIGATTIATNMREWLESQGQRRDDT